MEWFLYRQRVHWVLIAASFLVCSTLSASDLMVDTFEGANSPSPWIFSDGPPSSGVKGSLTRGVGHRGKGAHLAFDMSAGGNYVAATYLTTRPSSGAYLQFWVKNPGGVRLQVRLNDGTGQTLQYSPSRPLEATDANQWYQMVVQLGATPDHWGGRVNDGVQHGLISSVTIMAQPSLTKVGAIDFDDVKLLGARPTAVINPAAATVATPAVADFFGSLGVEITHPDASATGLDLVQSLGFHRVRTEMFWADIEQKAGVYDFSWYDQLVANLTARGLQAHFILCYGNAVYTGTDWFQPPRTVSAMQAYANFAQAAAAHYAGQGVHFEVWNEQNNATFWASPDATAYSPMCELATEGVHAGDPDAVVTTGGLAGIDYSFLAGMINDGAVNDADAVSIHPYRTAIPEQAADDVAGLRAELAQAFPTNAPPVWSSEAGYSSTWYGNGHLATNRIKQAKYSVRQMLTGLGLGLPVQIYFDLSDYGTDALNSEDNFGMVDANYQVKPLAAAMSTLYAMCKDHTFVGTLAAPQGTTHIFKFQGANDTVLVIWSETVAGKAQTLSFPVQPQQTLNFLNMPVTMTADSLGNYSVVVTDTPSYVSFSNSAIAAASKMQVSTKAKK